MNPFGCRVYRVSLRPEDCLALVFWTRNARPLMPHVSELRERGFRFYFHFTLNGYPREIDSHAPSAEAAVATLRRLAGAVGADLVMWRYDPVIFSAVTPMGYHLERFDSLSAALQGSTHRCYVSFLDPYGKTERNLRRLKNEAGLELRRPNPDDNTSCLRDSGYRRCPKHDHPRVATRHLPTSGTAGALHRRGRHSAPAPRQQSQIEIHQPTGCGCVKPLTLAHTTPAPAVVSIATPRTAATRHSNGGQRRPGRLNPVAAGNPAGVDLGTSSSGPGAGDDPMRSAREAAAHILELDSLRWGGVRYSETGSAAKRIVTQVFACAHGERFYVQSRVTCPSPM